MGGFGRDVEIRLCDQFMTRSTERGWKAVRTKTAFLEEKDGLGERFGPWRVVGRTTLEGQVSTLALTRTRLLDISRGSEPVQECRSAGVQVQVVSPSSTEVTHAR